MGMMVVKSAWAVSFWLSASLLIWTWVGYLVVLMILARARRRKTRWSTNKQNNGWCCPEITVVIAVHNEESVIGRRVRNCLDLDYPANMLEIIIVSDHSTDKTNAIVTSFNDPRIRLLSAKGTGKSMAQNEAVDQARGDIVVFTDADTLFAADFLQRIVRPFADPQIGCTTGRLIWTNPGESAVAEGGSLYWRYEHSLWQLESQIGVLACGSGACLAVRRKLFRPIEPQYGEDCVVPLDVIIQGYKVVFQPDAIAYEEYVAEPRAELRTRVRMTLRSFTGTLSRRQLLNPFYYPAVAWAIVSHKILRWLTPYFLLAALISNVFLLSQPFYRLTLAAQILFYLAALIGYLADRWHLRIPLVAAVYSFCLSNLAMLLGVTKALLGHQIVTYSSEG